jgi:hypothetical protein|tara:strand:+ start:447 stop:647 length:201 start_codon:yes stop_codon:yes gene_type:complete
MNFPLITRAALRILALIAVTNGYLTEGTASVIYQNADIVAMASLALSELYFAFDKWRDGRADRHEN